MISIDWVYKTVQFFANSDLMGNVKPDETRLAVNAAVEDIINDYFSEINRLANRENRGLIGNGLENMTDRMRDRVLYFLTIKDLTFDTDRFNLPDDLKIIDSVYFQDTEVELCKNMREFNVIKNLPDTNTNDYPIGIRIGNDIKIVPSTIQDNVSINYLRKHNIANWTFNIIGGTEIFNPSAPDFQDIDLHPSEQFNVIIKTLMFFGINLKEQDIVNASGNIQQQEFNQDNNL
jgi:hypothetical protein